MSFFMVKRAEFYIENNKVEVFHSLWKQFVHLNGKRVSEKFGLLQSEHYFKLNGSNYDLRLAPNFIKPVAKTLKVHKNSVPVNLENSIVRSSRTLLVLVIAVGIWLGFMIGINLYSAIWG
ncbi:hypothetical protein NQT66_19580 [Cellulophaga baltica]|jgi:hypothetical protein|nr:hypothetical protein [Cellulophaga baltica]MCR1027027.1 hypothetical protein [Cellulophaga baltica]